MLTPRIVESPVIDGNGAKQPSCNVCDSNTSLPLPLTANDVVASQGVEVFGVPRRLSLNLSTFYMLAAAIADV